jgi:hypothetical protein
MTEPTQPTPRQTTKVIQAVRDAHAKPSSGARYRGGFGLIALSAALFVLLVVFAQDLLHGAILWAVLAPGAIGLLILPFMEIVPASIGALIQAVSPLLPWNRGKSENSQPPEP